MNYLCHNFHKFCFTVIVILSFSYGYCESEHERIVEEKALKAAQFIEQRLTELSDGDFSVAPAGRDSAYGVPISKNTSHLNCLKTEIRAAFAEITLAQEQSKKPLGPMVVDALINVRSNDFFGTKGNIAEAPFNAKAKLIDRLAEEEDLRLSDNLFLLLKGPKDDHGTALRNWLDRSKKFIDPSFLTSKETMTPAKQAQLTRELVLFSVVLKSRFLERAKQESPRLNTELQNFITNDLNMAVRRYSRARYENDGVLRDRSLPVLFAAQKVVPGLGFDAIGVCRQKEVEKLALAHARGLAVLTEAIDAEMADTQLVRKSIGQIIHYKIQPFYIGSLEVRENGVLGCGPDQELDTILANADFFGRNGHYKEEVYKKRVKILEQLFLKPSSIETRDFLFALKSPQGWLDYFNKTLIESGDPNNPSCLEAIEKGQISALNLKNLFLARCMLSHDSFSVSKELTSGRNQIIEAFETRTPKLAENQFIKMPGRFNRVDVAFKEIEKLTPNFKLASLSIPTYNDYLNQKKDYNWAIASIPRDFISLADPNSSNMLDNEIGLFESDYIYRTGKFDKKLNPAFVKKLNEKLDIVLSYRDSKFTPPDIRRRRGFEVTGASINQLKVQNRTHPELEPTNPQLHDLLEGPDGGFGGLGELFLPDPKGYERRQSALDAIASSTELNLGETLFKLAIDAGVSEPTNADKAAAARRWLNYFKKTQSIARFHATPEELKGAIRGAFVCRLVMQTDSFLEVVEKSKTVGPNSPEDISSLLENSLTNQVQIVNSILSAVDPSTALNKDIDYIKERWYDMKAWHTESMKWLETIVADPMLMGEVSRIRSLSNESERSYDHISPAISKIERTLAYAETRIVAERNSKRRDGLFKPIDFANSVMAQVVTLENTTHSSRVKPEGDSDGPNIRQSKMEEVSREVTNELFRDVRSAINEAGFDRLSQVNDLEDFSSITRAYYNETDFSDDYEESAIHELMLHQMKGAVAKAKGNIEAERVTDLNSLEDLSLRASRADRIFFAGDPDRYALLIDPSFLLHEWNNRHKIKTIAEFRTVETRAQAQTQIFRYRKMREKLEEKSEELEGKREEIESRLANARKWAEENEYDFNPESVIDEMITMEDEIKTLKAQIFEQEKVEEKYRQHHFYLAQQLNQMRTEGKKFDRNANAEYLISQQAEKDKASSSANDWQSNNSSSGSNTGNNWQATNSSSSWQSSSSSNSWQKPKKTPTYTAPKRNYTASHSSGSQSYSSSNSSNSSSRYSRPQSSSNSNRRSNGGLLQRIFGRNR